MLPCKKQPCKKPCKSRPCRPCRSCNNKTVTFDLVSNVCAGSPICAQSVLGSDFTITTTNFYQDTLLSVTLPESGTYVISCEFRSSLTTPAFGEWWITGKLFDATAAADIVDTERMGVGVGVVVVTTKVQATSSISLCYTVAQPSIIRLEAKRDTAGGPGPPTAIIKSDSNGKSVLSYEKINEDIFTESRLLTVPKQYRFTNAVCFESTEDCCISPLPNIVAHLNV